MMSQTGKGGRVCGLSGTAKLIIEADDTDTASFFDGLFEVLSDRRRRLLLANLQTCDDVSIESLAATIAAEERGTTVDGVPEEDVSSIRMELFHRHLPKLVDLGYVDYDEDEARVSLTAIGERLDGMALERTMQ